MMIAPYAHVASLAEAGVEVRAEMMELTARAEKALREIYNPGGINLGMKLLVVIIILGKMSIIRLIMVI